MAKQVFLGLTILVCLFSISWGRPVTVQQLTFDTIGLPALPDPAGAPYVPGPPNPAWTVWGEIEYLNPEETGAEWGMRRGVLYVNDGNQTTRVSETNWWFDPVMSHTIFWTIRENCVIYGTHWYESQATEEIGVYTNNTATLWNVPATFAYDLNTFNMHFISSPGCTLYLGDWSYPSIFWTEIQEQTYMYEDFIFECQPEHNPDFLFETTYFNFENIYNVEVFENGIRFCTDVMYTFPEDDRPDYYVIGQETFWMPIPEPTSLFLLGAGVTLLRSRRTKRVL